MSSHTKIAEDLANLMTSAMGTATEMGRDAREAFKHRLEDMLTHMDIPRRTDLDTLNQRLAQQQVEIDALKAQLEDLRDAKKKKA